MAAKASRFAVSIGATAAAASPASRSISVIRPSTAAFGVIRRSPTGSIAYPVYWYYIGYICLIKRYVWADQILMIQPLRSEEHTSELQSLMRISYAVFCLKKKTTKQYNITQHT